MEKSMANKMSLFNILLTFLIILVSVYLIKHMNTPVGVESFEEGCDCKAANQNEIRNEQIKGGLGNKDVDTVFGTPVAISNMSPLTSIPRGRHDLSIPMIHSKSGQNDLLPFSEIMNSDIANYRSADDFKKAGIILVPNSKEEILDLTTEQFQKVTNSFVQDKDNGLLQKKYKNLFKPGHYGFGHASKIGEKFLKSYSDLLS